MQRRTFIAGGIKAGALLATGVGATTIAETLSTGPADATGVARGPGRRLPEHLNTTGSTSPVGVDPDGVTFAWQVSDAGRATVQRAYRIVLVGPRSSKSVVWDSGEVESSRQAFVEYGGPALRPASQYSWTVRTSTRQGHWSDQSEAATFRTGLRKSDWKANWLRPGPVDVGVEEYTYLRKTTGIPRGRIEYATAFVAAAHKYQLWVNGAKLDSGPSFCFPDEQYYQATDISHALVAGRPNAFGILHHWYGPGRGRPTSAPGLLLQIAVQYTNGQTLTMGTDSTWRTRRAEWLAAPQRNNDSGDFVEWIDARRTPVGWSTAAFDDTAWESASVLGPVGIAPFTHLYAERTRISEHIVRPVSVRTLPTGSVVVDFGKVYAGRPTVSFSHGVAGHTVPMHVGYSLDHDGSVSTTHGTQGTDLSFSYTQRSGKQTFEPYWYLGFRYLQIDGPSESLGKDQVALVARHSTMPSNTPATFKSSDPTLDAVWGLCAHSGLYASQEQFIDTPTREKGQFLWDAANESQTIMRVYGDQNLSWQGLRDMARAQARYWPTGQVNEVYPNDDGPQNYPTFTALYPEWVWRYYVSTGDRATVGALLPTLSKLSDYIVSTIDSGTGLISNQPMSTNGDDEYGYDFDTVADTTLNVLAVNVYNRIEAAATLVGDLQLASIQSLRSDSLTRAINSKLVRLDGLYADGLRVNGELSAHASQLANLSVLAYGVAPSSAVAAIAAYVASLDISVEPDHGMELLRALLAAGRAKDVVRILTDSSFPGWAAILKAGGTFTWETWKLSDLIGDSMSHGWGSSALVAMQEGLLGAVPSAAPPEGAPTVVSVTRPGAGLKSVSGTFPTPAGEFSISWRETSPTTRLQITVPPNAAALCKFPGALVSQVREGGHSVQSAAGVTVVASGSAGAELMVGSGSYEFEAPTV